MNRKHIRLVAISTIGVALSVVTQYFTLNNDQVAHAQSTRLRPDLNGIQLRNPGNGKIYWVDEGRIRHITNMQVYTNLFMPKTVPVIDAESISAGSPVNANNRLVRCGESNHRLKDRVYLLDQGRKRHISSPAVMDKNSFNWKAISNIACPALASIPDGSAIR